MPSSATNSAVRQDAQPWPGWRWSAALTSLTAAVLLVHGFHPLAEDGGLYAAGVEYTLDPTLFPHYTAFVTAHLRYSIFAPVETELVRSAGFSLQAALLLTYVVSTVLMLLAGRAILRRCTASESAQFAGVLLLAAGWTLPVAGTSLLLMDPYVTARSLSTPLSLWAIAFALDAWPVPLRRFASARRSVVLCAACLGLAALFHPLMAGYGLLFVAALRCTGARRPLVAWATLAGLLLAGCCVLHTLAPAESPALQAAAVTRYYWFLSQWQWYERLGLLGPVLVVGAILRFRSRALYLEARVLCRTVLLLCLLVTVGALLFAHEGAPNHLVARLQLLRTFLLLYAVMLLLLGMALATATEASLRTPRWWVSAFAAVAMAGGLFAAQRLAFPKSPHIELPARADQSPNPWVQAFLWARDHTPHNALFALDAKYVNTDGEDAQVFRAISLRSALPDYSKDGGEASITPRLAEAWQAGSAAQHDLSQQTDTVRDARLRPFGVTWMVLHAEAVTAHPCPFRNAVVKLCELK